MNHKKIIINAIAIILILGAVIAGYFYLAGGEGEEAIGLNTVGGETESMVSGETSEFLILLNSLKEVDLSGKIFSNNLFSRELVNFTTAISPREQGRANPFAPLGSANLSAGSPASDSASGEGEAEAVESADSSQLPSDFFPEF